MSQRRPTTKGFSSAASLLQQRIRKASETRGFAQSRVLTHWAEIAGAATAAISRPVEISYGRGGMGATLALLTTGAHAPMLEMQKEPLRERVTAVYGFNAIARIRITQTAASGFAEGQAQFTPAPKTESRPNPQAEAKAQHATRQIDNTDLHAALARLGTNVISKTHP